MKEKVLSHRVYRGTKVRGITPLSEKWKGALESKDPEKGAKWKTPTPGPVYLHQQPHFLFIQKEGEEGMLFILLINLAIFIVPLTRENCEFM